MYIAIQMKIGTKRISLAGVPPILRVVLGRSFLDSDSSGSGRRRAFKRYRTDYLLVPATPMK